MQALRDARILVTGACGFIGSHLTRRLVLEGADVHAVDVAETYRIKDVKEDISFMTLNLTDKNAVKRAVKKIQPDRIFHLASKTNVERGFRPLDEMLKVNLGGTMNLLSALDAASYDCFVNTGTCEEYGDNKAPFTEDQPPSPVSAYSASKAASTLFCSMYHRTIGCPIVTLRPFLTYGPMQGEGMLIPDLVSSSLRGESIKMTRGEQTREFNYVSDIVDGYIKAGSIKKAVGEVINIGNGTEYKVRDVAERIVSIVGGKSKPKFGALPYRPGEVMHFYCDNRKAKRILGWSPKVGLDEGLRRTVEWYRQNG